jgi:hypothetical protein
MSKIDDVDVIEWAELGARLAVVGPDKFAELIDAMRKIVDAQEMIAKFDWQLLFRDRPSKRYLA